MDRKLAAIVSASVAVLLLAFILPPLPGAQDVIPSNPRAPQIAIAITIFAAIWWISEVAPLGVTGVMLVVLFSLTGIVKWNDALREFWNPLIWIFIGGFTLAKAMQVWGLDKRIALTLASLYRGKDPALAALFFTCLPTALLTITGSITAATAMMYPLVLSLLVASHFEKGSRYAEGTMLALGQSASAGALLLLVSTPPNLIAKAAIEQALPGTSLTFFDWLFIGTPQAILAILITWFVIYKLFLKPELSDISPVFSELRKKRSELGRMNRGEKYVLALVFLALVLWVAPGITAMLAEFNPSLVSLNSVVKNYLPEYAPAVLVLAALFLIPAEGRQLLRFPEFVAGVDWNTIFMFGGSFVLGLGLTNSGAVDWVVNYIRTMGLTLGYFEVFSISAIVAFVVTYPASNTAAATVTVPVAIVLSKASGLNPLPAVIAAAIASSISSALPSTTPPMAIVYGSGYVKTWDMFKVGMVSDLVRLALLLLIGPPMVQALMSMKGLI